MQEHEINALFLAELAKNHPADAFLEAFADKVRDLDPHARVNRLSLRPDAGLPGNQARLNISFDLNFTVPLPSGRPEVEMAA